MDKKECCNSVSKAIFRIWDALKLHFVSCIICVGTVTTTNKINKKVHPWKRHVTAFSGQRSVQCMWTCWIRTKLQSCAQNYPPKMPGSKNSKCHWQSDSMTRFGIKQVPHAGPRLGSQLFHKPRACLMRCVARSCSSLWEQRVRTSGYRNSMKQLYHLVV